MQLLNEAVFQARYRIKSFDPETNLPIVSDWSPNKIMKKPETGKLINETGLPTLPKFQLGNTDTNDYTSFQNVIALTHTTQTEVPLTHGWVDNLNPSLGYWFKGGGEYKFTPQVTGKGNKANQVGIENFSIAPVMNDRGIPFQYPVNQGVEITIDFEIKITYRPEAQIVIPMVKSNGELVQSLAAKCNMAFNQAEFEASNYRWQDLASRVTGLIGNESVAGNVNDPNALKTIELSPNRWSEVISGTVGSEGDYRRRGMVYSGLNDQKFIRFGLPSGIPGFYISLLFNNLVTFQQRYLYDVVYDITYSDQWSG